MVYQWLFQMIFLLWPLSSSYSSALAKAPPPPPPPLSKPNCLSSCGDVIIPFPFGMGANYCYLNDSFAIDCKSNNKPFLRSINLEVLNISLTDLTIRVQHPVSNSCLTINETKILENTPFYYSHSNKFTSIGCNNIAFMSDFNNSRLGGCSSICSDERGKTEFGDCNGINCCQTTVPWKIIQSFNTSFEAMNFEGENYTQECKYAFLVETEWFDNEFTYPDEFVQNWTQVPVVLDWNIFNSSLDLSWREHRSSTECYDEVLPFLLCFCRTGYEGNPYLLDGCHDIDECATNGAACERHMICKNTNGSHRCIPHKDANVSIIILGIGTGLGGLLLLIVGWRLCIIILKRIKRKEELFKRNGGLLLQQHLNSLIDGSVDRCRIFNSKELNKATDNFNVNRILGQGGQGTVYKGMLADGKVIAVKKSKLVDESKLKEFVNEVVILSQIHHRNVVKLLGCCFETEAPLLVYEFIPNGTLFHYLHDENEELPPTWDMRLRIASEVAGALSYLHSAASLPIYHRDIKSTNILLDDKYRVKLADFGTSRSVAMDETHVTTRVQGTFGYLDPEYFRSSQFTDKSDVYSFGVVLVELLTGQKPICLMRSEGSRSLVTYFIACMEENRLCDILHAQVIKQGKQEEIMAIANIASRCLNPVGKKRPTMKEVAVELEAILVAKNESKMLQNFVEIEYRETEVTEPSWNVVSTSTSTSFEDTN
ncbi:hypothetical protein ACOSQ2_004406 [Xanthoceras sorbifolium]